MTNYKFPRDNFRYVAICLFTGFLCAIGAFYTAQASPPTPRLSADGIYSLSSGHSYPQNESEWVNVVVELTQPSVTDLYASLTANTEIQAAQVNAATRIHLADIMNAQDAVEAQLTALGAETIYRVQRVYNGIAVHVPKERLAEIYDLPNVQTLHPLTSKWPDHQISVPFIGTEALWNNAAIENLGVSGEGVKIAVIDTGVDYLHPTFGGPASGYDRNDKTLIDDVPGFPNAKIVGGYDFVGENYNSDPEDPTYQPDPEPDADPMDCYNHGTHVTGTVAGYGLTGTVTGNDGLTGDTLTSNGEKYNGPYQDIDNLNTLFIGPGVAPLAQVYALKVFGCRGSSDVTDLAIEWSVDPNGDGDFSDRVDVINMSLGSTYGAHEDMTARASNNATKVGIIVVASAGNSGDSHYATGTPAAADHVISVAAIKHKDQPDTLAWFSSRGPRRGDAMLKPDIAAPGFEITSASMSKKDNDPVRRRDLPGTSMAAPHVAGAMALLRQVYPDWTVDELKALVMNTAMPWIRTEQSILSPTYSPTRVGSGRIDLEKAIQNNVLVYNADDPGLVSVSFGTPQVLQGTTAIKNIRVANKGNEPVTYTLTYVGHTDMPGVEFILPDDPRIQVAGNSYTNLPVSMHVDGAKVQHVRDETMAEKQDGISRQWIGEETGYLLFWPDKGRFEASLTDELIQNVSSTAQGVARFEYDPVSRVLRYELSIEQADEIGVTSIQLRRGLPGVQGVAAQTLYTSASSQASLDEPFVGSFSLAEEDERLLLNGGFYVNVNSATNIDGELRGQLESVVPILNVPIYAAPRVASKMRASEYKLTPNLAEEKNYEIDLEGVSLVGDNPPLDVVSMVTALELQYSSKNTFPLELDPDLADPDKIFTEFDHADLKYVGVASNFGLSGDDTPSIQNTTVYFGVVTYGERVVPNEVEFSIYTDVDQDGIYEYRLFNSDVANYNNRTRISDAFVTALEQLTENDKDEIGSKSRQKTLNIFGPDRMDTAIYHTDMMILPVSASEIGLTNSNTDFNYYIETESGDEENSIIDRTPVLRYDAARPGLSFYRGLERTPLHQDLPENKIFASFNRLNYTINRSQGLLLLHHHNLSGERDQVLSIEYEWPFNVYMPLIME